MIRSTNWNYGDLGGCYSPRMVRLRRITPPEISIILQIIRKPNSNLNILLIIQHNSQHKNNLKRAYLHTCPINVKFSSSTARFSASSGDKGTFSSANILQMAGSSLSSSHISSSQNNSTSSPGLLGQLSNFLAFMLFYQPYDFPHVENFFLIRSTSWLFNNYSSSPNGL